MRKGTTARNERRKRALDRFKIYPELLIGITPERKAYVKRKKVELASLQERTKNVT